MSSAAVRQSSLQVNIALLSLKGQLLESTEMLINSIFKEASEKLKEQNFIDLDSGEVWGEMQLNSQRENSSPKSSPRKRNRAISFAEGMRPTHCLKQIELTKSNLRSFGASQA